MRLLLLTVSLVVLSSGRKIQKRQDIGDYDSGASGGDGLEAILGSHADTILTRTGGDYDVDERAVHGTGCTTPQGTQGVCSYITDPPCEEVLGIIQQVGVTQTIINYLKQAIQSPCGKDVLDYTMCCEGVPSVQPPVVKPPVVTPQGAKDCGLNEKPRIVNGQASNLNDWPWAVIVGKLKEPTFQVICGGTLINERYVLTASHCFVGQASQSTHVRVGELDISTTADGANHEDIAISKIITHPDYTSTALQSDIALVQLSRPVVFRIGLQPACLPDQYVGSDLTSLTTPPVVVGWGSTVTGGSTVSALREARIGLIPKSKCEVDYAPVSRIKITENQICAGNGAQDTCTGDSGGPMLTDQIGRRFAVIGITSFGVKCADAKFPGVYTRVDKFLSWIRANMN